MIIDPPSMKSINKLDKPWTGMSFFAGCGGSSIGHKQSGINMLASNEFVDIARETYEINNPGTLVLGQDIRRLDPRKILQYFDMKPKQLDFMDGSPPCFLAGTLITTSNGLIPIEEVQVGDKVLTHKQRMKHVTELLPKTYHGTLYKIKAYHSSIEATDEHPIYARLNKGGKITRNLQKAKWVAAEDMTLNHYVGIPTRYKAKPYIWEGIDKVYYHRTKGTYEVFDHVNTLPVHDPDFWWVVGRWLGDGWTRFHENEEGVGKKRKTPRHSTVICCDNTDGGIERQEIISRLDRLGFKHRTKKHRTSLKITFNGKGGPKETACFFQQFGKGAANKFLPGDVLDLPKELLVKLFSGYMSADGSHRGDGVYRYSSVSHKLALNIAQIIARLYRVPVNGISGSEQHPTASYIEGREVTCRTIYVGSFRLNPDKSRIHYEVDEKDVIWVPVKSITEREYHGPVYNFSVAKDETYVANNLIVHNCKGFSTAGVVDKGWGKEVQYSDNKVQQVDDLFDQYCRMLEVMQPKTFTAENVSGLVKGKSKGYFLEVMKQFRALGYKVRAPMLNSAWLGVPQSRERIIFMGVREDLGYDVPSVTPLPSMALLGDHPKLKHIVAYKHLKKGLIKYMPACNSPMPTITASDNIAYETARFSTAGFIETDKGDRRKLTIEELKYISGVPQDYELLGNFEQQWERLGRICVPAVAHAASKALVEQVLIPYYKSKKAKPGSRIK